ncbi:hypothetical protein DFH11DRAFT_1731520 [Phellopilus nigrolimitatus]|nr:hypothetical protein DFH11DRAFT_1731520 [Phellopilus nigrolimitatus]
MPMKLRCVHQLTLLAYAFKREQRQEYFHKMMYMVMGDKNHVGPVEDVFNVPSDRKKHILDVGAGSGLWAIQIADKVPDIEVIEDGAAKLRLFDAQLIPYPNEYFDIMKNYPLFLEEVARILRPGCLIILIESEIKPLSEGKQPIFRRCLAGNHIDTTVPTRLSSLLRASDMFNDIVAKVVMVPVGFWPKDQGLFTVAQFSWIEHDYFILVVRPLFLSYSSSRTRNRTFTTG